MSNKSWYEGLTADDFEDKHVRAVSSDGAVIEGPLRIGDGPAALISCNGADVCVLAEYRFWDGGKSWELSDKIESVSLVWDERDWEQIRTVDISKADAVVVNGRLIRVNGLFSPHQFRPVDGGVSVPFEHVSCALRRRSKLPTELGAYRGADGTLLIHYRSMMGDHRWRCLSRDFLEDRIYSDDALVNKYLPLAPVHFVDGRAE